MLRADLFSSQSSCRVNRNTVSGYFLAGRDMAWWPVSRDICPSCDTLGAAGTSGTIPSPASRLSPTLRTSSCQDPSFLSCVSLLIALRVLEPTRLVGSPQRLL